MSHSKTILILSANPKDTARLRLDEEVHEIGEGLKRSRNREQFILQHAWAVNLRELRRAMLDYEPQIVHFCGHGGMNGLMVEDDAGNAVLVNPEALAGLFRLFKDKMECVLLNACYSATQADGITQHIKYVIGMTQGITDKAALEFAIGFYDALGAGKPYEEAFEFGCNAIQFYNLPEQLTPVLKKCAISPAIQEQGEHVEVRKQPESTANIDPEQPRELRNHCIQSELNIPESYSNENGRREYLIPQPDAGRQSTNNQFPNKGDMPLITPQEVKTPTQDLARFAVACLLGIVGAVAIGQSGISFTEAIMLRWLPYGVACGVCINTQDGRPFWYIMLSSFASSACLIAVLGFGGLLNNVVPISGKEFTFQENPTLVLLLLSIILAATTLLNVMSSYARRAIFSLLRGVLKEILKRRSE